MSIIKQNRAGTHFNNDTFVPAADFSDTSYRESVHMNQSVKKALGLLELFTEDRPELTLKDIADLSGMPKPTVYRLLTTLEASGFLYKIKDNVHDSRYRLGLKLLELGQMVSNQLELREISLPFMERLANEINEVIHLVIIHQNKATYIEKVDSTRALRLYTRVGKSLPLYIGSGPKLLLAFLPEEKQDEILNQPSFNTYIQGHGRNIENFQSELATIRKTGYAYSVGEQDADTTGISYPVYNHLNEVVAALAVSGLSSHFAGDNLYAIKQNTKRNAELISRQLGYVGKM